MKYCNLEGLTKKETREISGGTDPITAAVAVLGLVLTGSKLAFDFGRDLYKATHASQYKE